MKQPTKYLLLIIAGAVIFFLGRGCKNLDPHPTPPLINSDSIAQLAYSKGYEIAKLEQIGRVKDSIQTHYVTRWKVYREKAIHDTINRECIANCDSALNTQSDYICHLETISAHKDTAITYWRSAYRGDSTNVNTLRSAMSDTIKHFGKRVRRGYFKGFAHGFAAGNVTGASATSAVLK